MINVLGLMTGTSCDGLDAACLSIEKNDWSPAWQAQRSYPVSLRKRVLELQAPDSRVTLLEILNLNRDLGIWYADAVTSILKGKKSSNAATPDLIANHGQTVGHFPSSSRSNLRSPSRSNLQGVTLQLGDPTLVAMATETTVASTFRNGDLAAHGQGAPLVPLFHASLVQKLGGASRGVSIHNLGGISNLTYLWRDKILAFDTGPGNIWIDAATSLVTSGKLKMDRGGKLGAKGLVNTAWLNRTLKHPF